jgi:putative DNA primase/helicase
MNAASDFLAALAAAGLDFPGEIIPDGRLHRIKVNGDHNPNSWYVLHSDGLPAGIFGDWKRGISETWCAKASDILTEAERADRDRKWKQQQAEREADRQRQQAEARAQAQAILDAAQPATDDHPYLLRKRVKAHPGVMAGPWPQRQRENCLLIPLRTASGQLATVQAIYPDKTSDGRDKDFLRGGAKRGAHFVIGDLTAAPCLLIAEGYATAATLHEATGHAAIMAVDAGNMQPVAEALRAIHPDRRIVIAADHDRHTEGNPGLTQATAVAQAIHAGLAVPEFAEGEAGTDFNDLAALHGLEAVCKAVAQARPQEQEQAGPAEDARLALDAYRGTDDANAALLLDLHGQDIRYCPPWEKWLIWSGSHWRMDDALDIDRLAADLPRLLYRRAGDAADSGERRKIAALAGKLERTALRSTMLTAARHRVVVRHTDLDKGHFLLNARNGTVDLRTGALRPHARADLLTHDTEIQYRPDATAPTWIRFLHDVFAGDADLIQFVQRAIGYSLTGCVKEQVIFIPHGCGSNGKSVFLNILQALLGKLAWQAAPDLLLQDRHRRHPTEQADLFGKRIIVCQETGEGRRFNETLVKQLTGGDAITARRMHEDFWSFNPTHKIWLSTNHRPEIRGTDYAIWRRIRLIPFGVTFADDSEPRKNPDMERQLLAELPGILAWSVRGCLDWQKHGLGMAEAVKTATASYQAEMDVLAGWIADCCVIHRNAKARASALYRSYSDWCDASGETPEPQRRWGMRLHERGFQRYSNDGVWYRGIGMRTEGTEGTEPKKAGFSRDMDTSSKTAKSGSVGSVGSVVPPDDDPPSPPGDASKPVDPLEVRIAELIAAGWHPVNARAKAEQEAREVSA